MRLAGEPISLADECRHIKLIGTTGTGKSTVIAQLLRQALARGDRAVVSDADGAYARQLGQRYRGDQLLTPFESQGARWDLLSELEAVHDAEQIAAALIPVSDDAASQEWRSYARTWLAALLQACRTRGGDLALLWHWLAVSEAEELRPMLAGTPAQPFVAPDNARMFGSIRAVAISALAAVEHVARQRGAPLSIRSWVRDGRGVLFLPYRSTQVAALRGLISAWVRIAILETMLRPAEGDGRLWFVVDELDALGAIDGLKDALARLRKYGGRCILGFQSIAQVSGTYGAAQAQTIVENCGTTLILRCAASEQGGTSAFASRLIGEREITRRHTVLGRDRERPWGPARHSRQISTQTQTESAVLASQIEQLPDLQGYLKRASSPDWRRVQVRR